ncbi:phosphatidylglycerophosphatase A [Arcticibacter sp. MXS-1]|uniref:phosphatidylglycerophosphatase A family protein n=1 Tax=Arcticibacter sp. MXS-1 TaxID=3341726 RepID=UPI0035A8A796
MYKLISTGLGIGYIRKGGGSVAAAFAALLIILCQTGGNTFSITTSVIITIALIGAGTLSSYKVEPFWGKDNYRVVIDEIAGMWISVLFLPVKVPYVIAGFILFRFFDIVKPLFIRRMERLPGGVGVMMDDVLAAIYTNILLQIAVAYNLF